MTAQTPAGGITDPKFLDQDRIVEATLVEIAQCLGVVIELLLIESGSLRKYGARVVGRMFCGVRQARLWRKDRWRDNWTKRIRSPPWPQP